MALRVIWKCDKCGVVNDDANEMGLFEVGVGIEHIRVSSKGGVKLEYVDAARRKGQWCRKCCEEAGLLSTAKPEGDTPSVPTLEELIREIVRRVQP